VTSFPNKLSSGNLDITIPPDIGSSLPPANEPSLNPKPETDTPKGSHPRNILLWFTLMAALLAAGGYMAYHYVNAFIRGGERGEQTHQVLSVLNETLTSLINVESGGRGFMITGNNEHLEPTYAARQQVYSNLKTLRQLMDDNPDQQRRLTALEKAINERLELINAAVTIRQQEGFEAMLKFGSPGKGKPKMDEIRALVGEMEIIERQLLQERNRTTHSSARAVVALVLVGIGLSFSILLIVYFMIRRESMQRVLVEEGLEKTNAQLQDGLDGMEQLTREMNLAATMGELLQSCLTFEEAGKVINKAVPRLLPGTSGALCIINPSKNFVETVMAWGEDEPSAVAFAPHECWALRRGRMHYVRNEMNDMTCEHAIGQVSHGCLCVPLVAHGETLGVFYLCAKRPDALNDKMQRIIRTLTEQFSLTLANLRLQQTLRTQSIRDPLTGLFNRRYMEASLEREMIRAKRHETPLSVIMLDVDHFKRFNDTFGHGAGDVVIQELGKVLKSCARGEDIVCRYGGEEFIIILPGASLEIARQRAERINEAVRRLQIEYHGQALACISVSLGVAAYPQHSDSHDELVRTADAALYRAKQTGRDRVVVAEFNPNLKMVAAL
jgi:diguanylate cyclase (GGDEF)-like protein